MANKLTGKDLADFTDSKVGTPYVYGAKGANGPLTRKLYNSLKSSYPNIFTKEYCDLVEKRKLVGKVCTDCSGLISWYTGKVMSSAKMYQTAKTRLKIKDLDKFAVGTVLWKSGHVGVYVGKDKDGNHLCTEAKGIVDGTVKGVITNAKRWTYGLVFDYIDYTYTATAEHSYREANPYKKPTSIVKLGTMGESAKWVQHELIESGFGEAFIYKGIMYPPVTITGIIDNTSDAAIRAFQQSCKLTVDGKAGTVTINELYVEDDIVAVKANPNPYKKPTTSIKKGSKGEGVKWLQFELRKVGYNKAFKYNGVTYKAVEIDGEAGPILDAAIRSYQSSKKLTVDGVAGPKTIDSF